MLKRKLYDYLVDWKKRKHLPLVVYGQRQIGKTFTIDQFAKDNYGSYVYVDLSVDGSIRDVFEQDDRTVQNIMLGIRTLRGLGDLDPSDTLIFLDEIQDCPAAESSLKTFALDGKYDVIASGSMLGVANHRSENPSDYLTPLGYVEMHKAYGLDFEEFLWANNVPQEAIDLVRRSITECIPIPTGIYKRLSELFRAFQITGGFPASVQAHIDKPDSFNRSESVLASIVTECTKDIIRYNSGNDIEKTADCFDSIPMQLSSTNKRFKYSAVPRKNKEPKKGRDAASKYMGNLLWIKAAGYGNFCYSLRQIASPLKGQMNPDTFKVYLSDTGMLAHMYGDDAIAAIYRSDTAYNFGALTENAVAECLMKCGYTPAYYKKTNGDSRMEIDFVLELSGGLAAIEVKSGRRRDTPSLSKVGEYFHVARRIMLENGNIRRDPDGVEHYPLFAAAFIEVLDPKPDFLRRTLHL